MATAATDAFAPSSSALTLLGQLVAGLLNVLSLPFVAALYAADALGNVVAHRAEFQADRRVVRMGYGRNLLPRPAPGDQPRRRPAPGRLAGPPRRVAPPAARVDPLVARHRRHARADPRIRVPMLGDRPTVTLGGRDGGRQRGG